jgi:hypothetical protein
VTLFLWRKAHAEHYKEGVGSVLLLWSPQVKRDGAAEGGGSSYSLHVDKPEGLQRVGVASDFAFCKGKRKVGLVRALWALRPKGGRSKSRRRGSRKGGLCICGCARRAPVGHMRRRTPQWLGRRQQCCMHDS